MKAADYLADKRARKGKKPTSQETARNVELELRRMGFDDEQARDIRLECDELAEKGSTVRQIEKYVRDCQRTMQRSRRQAAETWSKVSEQVLGPEHRLSPEQLLAWREKPEARPQSEARLTLAAMRAFSAKIAQNGYGKSSRQAEDDARYRRNRELPEGSFARTLLESIGGDEGEGAQPTDHE